MVLSCGGLSATMKLSQQPCRRLSVSISRRCLSPPSLLSALGATISASNLSITALLQSTILIRPAEPQHSFFQPLRRPIIQSSGA